MPCAGMPAVAGNRGDYHTLALVQEQSSLCQKWLRARANIRHPHETPAPSVCSRGGRRTRRIGGFVRRLLLRQRLYGTKLGFVWVIYPDDLEAFKLLRRPPGRPRKTVEGADK